MTVRLPAWLNAAGLSYPAENDRLTLGSLWTPSAANQARTGVIPGSSGALAVAAQSTPNMTVQVAAGQAVVQGTLTSTQGAYVVTNDAAIASLSVAAADPTNPRIDIVVVTVQDAQYSGAANQGLIQVVTGTPAPSPSAPATPANSLVLAQIAVAANQTTVTSGNITDKRVWTTAMGGVLPVLSTARPGSPYAGMTIFETDTKITRTWDGTQWAEAGAKKSSFVATWGASLQSVATSSTVTAVLATAAEDTDSAYNTGTGVYTVQTSGLWLFTFGSGWASNGTGARQISVNVAGTPMGIQSMLASVEAIARQQTAVVVRMTAGQTVSAQVFQSSGGALNFGIANDTEVRFTGTLLSA